MCHNIVKSKKVKTIIYPESECPSTLTSSKMTNKKHNGSQMKKMKLKQKVVFAYLKILEILDKELATIIKVPLIFLTAGILGTLVVVELIQKVKFPIEYRNIEDKLIS